MTTDRQVRARLSAMGCTTGEIEATVDLLAEQRRDDEQDRKLEELAQRVVAQGYSLDELERDNPYNQRMYQ